MERDEAQERGQGDVRLGLITSFDPLDPISLGGRIYGQVKAFERQVETAFLGPLATQPRMLLGARHLFHNRLVRRRWYDYKRDALLMESYAQQLTPKVAEAEADVLLSTMHFGSQPVARLEATAPIVIWTDCPFSAASQIYPSLRPDRLVTRTLRDARQNEELALHRARLVAFASEWARRSAIDAYGLSPEKVVVVPFGASIAHPWGDEEVEAAIRARPSDQLRLLFVGGDWNRKGGEQLLTVVDQIHRSGIDVCLYVVGTEPNVGDRSYVKILGHLDKTSREGEQMFADLLSSMHFLTVLSTAEAFGLVFAEASAFGVPSVALDVGGVDSAVKPGVNGLLFSPDVSGDEIADHLINAFQDENRYGMLARASRREYVDRLNWDAAVSEMLGHILQVA